MAKHLIFLVHGMGRYGRMADGAFKPDTEGWFKDAQAALRSSYDGFIAAGMGQGVAFDARFEVVNVIYDDIFEEIRAAYDKQADAWKTLGLTDGIIGRIQSVLAQKNEDDFLWTHAADVAFYAIPLVRDAVKMHVINQMLDKLAKTVGAASLFDTWSVVAHSLGTAVVHDCLTLLQHRAREKFGDWLPPRALCMIANVARALTNNDASCYDDAVAPSGPGHPDVYLSANHALDPFTRIDPFRPTSGGWVAPGARYRDLSGLKDFLMAKEAVDWAKDWQNFDKFAALVPHGFSHYLRQPPVVLNMWCGLLARPPAMWLSVQDAVRQDNAATLRQDIAATLEDELSHLVGQAEAQAEKTIGSFLKILARLESF